MTHDLEAFLESYQFHPNNIEFRIAASSCFEKYKNVQAFQLNQLINGKFYFSQTRREILLLKYNLWTQWLYAVEQYFVGQMKKYPSPNTHNIDYIIDLAIKTAAKYKNIIIINKEKVFDPEFSLYWLDLHENIFGYMLSEIAKIKDQSYEETFVKITNILCEVMQYTLIEIFELNNVYSISNKCLEEHKGRNQKYIEDLDDKSIFIVFTDLACKHLKETGFDLTRSRVKFYKEHFDFKEVYFKNYTNKRIEIEQIESIEETGVHINYKKSISPAQCLANFKECYKDF